MAMLTISGSDIPTNRRATMETVSGQKAKVREEVDEWLAACNGDGDELEELLDVIVAATKKCARIVGEVLGKYHPLEVGKAIDCVLAKGKARGDW